MKRIKTIGFIAILSIGLIILQTSSCFSRNEFNIKGFHLDLRIQVMKPEALKDLARELSGFGINTLIMEWEGTFPYESHPLIPNRYAYTKEEIGDFIRFCEGLNIDVIPLQQSFGHVEYILRHYKYQAIREDQKDVSQVCPLKQDLNKTLFTELFTEMASLHPSSYFHIGGDETYLLGHCDECSKKAEKDGKSNLYIDHIKMLCDIVTGLGKKPVLWADIALKYPEALGKLPKETIFIDWNYGWKADRFGDLGKLVESGFEIWGAPSLRSSPDNYFITLWDKHMKNIHDFIPAARELGYSGMIMTSWSTSGRYSTIFESRWKIIDLLPIRRVYPLTAFRIPMAAYAKAIDLDKPLDMNSFIIEYCRDRYGFDAFNSKRFWTALNTTPYQVDNGNVVEKTSMIPGMLLDSTRTAIKILHELRPSDNKDEFEHYRLMMEIRENYLSYKLIEMQVNSEKFEQGNLPPAISELKKIIQKGEELDKKFIRLNKDSYYLQELEEENRNRNLPAILLYERVSRMR